MNDYIRYGRVSKVCTHSMEYGKFATIQPRGDARHTSLRSTQDLRTASKCSVGTGYNWMELRYDGVGRREGLLAVLQEFAALIEVVPEDVLVA